MHQNQFFKGIDWNSLKMGSLIHPHSCKNASSNLNQFLQHSKKPQSKKKEPIQEIQDEQVSETVTSGNSSEEEMSLDFENQRIKNLIGEYEFKMKNQKKVIQSKNLTIKTLKNKIAELQEELANQLAELNGKNGLIFNL